MRIDKIDMGHIDLRIANFLCRLLIHLVTRPGVLQRSAAFLTGQFWLVPKPVEDLVYRLHFDFVLRILKLQYTSYVSNLSSITLGEPFQ